MSLWARTAAAIVAVVAVTASGTTVLAAPGGGSSATAVDIFRYHEASVFVDGGPGGFVGAVNIRSVAHGETTVDVFLGSEEPVTCPDGSEDVRNETLRTEESFSSEPGPVVLDVDPRLQAAHGEAVVDLVLSVLPGCGAEEEESLLPAQDISIDFTGTSGLIRARMGGSASSGNAFDRAHVSSIARDGTGHAVVGSFVDADSDASWLKYAVEHFARRGTQPGIPENPAAVGGRGALRGASTSYEPADGLGLLFKDAIVAATIGAAPGREMLLSASTMSVTGVRCGTGDVGYQFRDTYGSVETPVVIDRRLASARASGTAQLTEVLFDECTGAETSRLVTAPVALDLSATGRAVRVRDTYYFSAPPQPVTRINGWSLRREAAGTVAVGTYLAPTDFGAISRASR